MADPTRLMLPFEAGDIITPETGTIAALRAQPGLYQDFPTDRLHCVQGFYPTSHALIQSGLTCTPTLPQSAALVLVHLTRSKDENRANIAQGYQILEPNGQLVVDGAKTDGIDSLLKAIKQHMPTDGQLSKAHGKVFWLTKNGSENPFDQWLTPLIPTENSDGWITAAGMFSADGIDPGSAELAAILPEKLKGKGADLGAGWGWLAGQALQSNEKITSLDLIEAEYAALDCARQNVTDPRATYHWNDATTLTAGSYDFAICNPPFHTGRASDPALGRSFIQSAAKNLKPTGQLYLVANRQLAYETTLEASFGHWQILGQTSRYKVIHARKPKQPRL